MRLTNYTKPSVAPAASQLGADIRAMHAVDGHEDGDVPVDVVTTRSQTASKLRASGELPAPSTTSTSGEKV